MSAYWSQFSSNELMSMQGIEINDPEYKDKDYDYEYEEEDQDKPCSCGTGCNYCLML